MYENEQTLLIYIYSIKIQVKVCIFKDESILNLIYVTKKKCPLHVIDFRFYFNYRFHTFWKFPVKMLHSFVTFICDEKFHIRMYFRVSEQLPISVINSNFNFHCM